MTASSFPRPRRRTAAVVAATTLALPLTVAAVAPASAAVVAGSVRTVDAPLLAPTALIELTEALTALGLYGGTWPGQPWSPSGYGSYGSHGTYGGYGTTTSTADPSQTSVATAAESAGLVEITSTLVDGEAAGTGMVIGSEGSAALVVTNHHVIAGSTSITVTDVATGDHYAARVLGYDATKDVAVLALPGAAGLTSVTTDTSPVGVGDSVTSVGDAGGDGGTLTAAPGTVSKVRTSITVSDDDGGTSRLTREIEVAADIVPGDSGGALFSSTGAALGMNVAASSGSAQVTGYVIPIARVLKVANQVLADDDSGSVTLGYPAFLGVGLSGSSSSSPAVVGSVETGSAADDARLVAGDTITSVGGTATGSIARLRRAIAAHEPGDTVALTWTTASGATRSAQVTLGRGPIS